MEDFNQVCFLLFFSFYFEKFSYTLYLKEKLFDIARRVPFLAMTIVEKNHLHDPWLFRTQPLQTGSTESTREVPLEPAQSPTSVSKAFPTHPTFQRKQLQQQKQPQQYQLASSMAMPSVQVKKMPAEQHLQQIQNMGVRVHPAPIPNDPKKVVKSSTAPNLPTSNSLNEMFRVI